MSIAFSSNGSFPDLRSADSPDPGSDPQVIPGNTEFGNRYPRAFKLKVLRESDSCTKPGELGKYLRTVGITHTTLTCFRKQRAAGTLSSPVPTPNKRRNPSGPSAEEARRLMLLERENRQLKRRLEQAEAIIEIQKKVSRLLEISFDDPESKRSGS